MEELEYFFGADPGLGQGTSVSLPIVQDASTTFSVDLSGLTEGIHSLSVRARNEAQVWSQTTLWQIYKLQPQNQQANINKIEYFIDTDPGLGNGFDIPVTPATDINNLSVNLDVSGLSLGFHSINVRSRTATGEWSHTNQFLFYKVPAPNGLANIEAVEYFIDLDPGFGNGTALSGITLGTDISKNFTLNLNGLDEGFHTLFLRAKDELGQWSHAAPWFVYKLPNAGSEPDIVEAEYFWDTDPGIGNATSVPNISNAEDINGQTFSVDLSGLTDGFHVLQVRSKDENGVWSHTNKWLVYKLPDAANQPDIVEAEYFWNADPGFGNGQVISGLTANVDVNTLDFNIDISSLNLGFNVLNIRSKDANGIWSHTNKWLVYKVEDASARPDIVEAEYFIDSDPGIGLGTSIDLPDATDIANETIVADLTGLPIGDHQLFIRTKDGNGVWTLTQIHDFFGGDYPQRPGSGTALHLAAANDEIEIGDAPELQLGNNDFTIECWVKPTDLPSGNRPVAIGRWNSRNAQGTNEWAIELSSNGSDTKVNVVFENGNDLIQVTSPNDLELDKWYHLTAVKFGDEMFLYVNGITAGDAFIGGQNINVINGLDLTIGNSASGDADANAVIDEVRIWNTALFTPTLRDWMCKKLAPDHPSYVNLVSYYRFDEGSGNSLIDVRGTNTGTLANTSNWETSGAPIGDASAWDYDADIEFELNHPNGDGLAVQVTAGAPDGVQIYRVDEAPNTSIPPATINSLETSRYYGVFVTGGTNPTYTVQYDFVGSNYSDPVDFVAVATREDNADTSWEDLEGDVIIPPGYVEKTGQSGTEYILARANYCTLLPSFSFAGPDTLQLCAGSSTTLNGPGGFTQYDWSTGASSSALTVSTADTYILTVTNAQGCSAVDTVVVEVNPVPIANVAVSGDLQLCAGESVTLIADSGYDYQWNTGATTQSIIVSNPGNYVVTVTNGAGCSSFSPTVPVVFKDPLVGFSVTDPLPVYYLTTANPTVDVSFSATTNGNIVSYLWDFGDGGSSTDPNPTHTYNAEGFYDIEVQVTDDEGCSETILLSEYVVVWRVFPTVDISPPGVTETCISTSFISPFAGCVAFPNGGAQGGGYVYTTGNGGGNWTISQINSNLAVQDIYLTGNSGFIFGSNGLICVSNNFGNSWVPFSTGTSATFFSGWFSSPTYGWAVGSAGTICLYNGSNWVPFATGVNNTFRGVYGFGSNAWAVGSGGIICIYNGTTWVPQVSGTVNQLNGVYFVDNNTGYAVGNSGTILKTENGGGTWINVGPAYPWNLNAVYCLDANNIICVGDNGVVLISNDGGVTWQLFSIGSSARLTDCTVVNCTGYITAVDGQVFTFDFPGCTPVALPVELTRFTGTEQDQQVLLEWHTETELNNDYFEVQRSSNGLLFEAIGRVQGAGSTDLPQFYNLLDETPNFGDNYYRLKQVDFDGTYEFSEVVVVSVYPKGEALDLYPNVVSDLTILEWRSQTEGPDLIEIVDELGRIVKRVPIQTLRGANRIDLNVSELPVGAYFLRLASKPTDPKPFIKP
ncbi:MAG: LamG-like jellyroll fold domain-containing protein [Bacteroidota bacterium]